MNLDKAIQDAEAQTVALAATMDALSCMLEEHGMSETMQRLCDEATALPLILGELATARGVLQIKESQ